MSESTNSAIWLKAAGIQMTNGRSTYHSSSEIDRLRELDASIMQIQVASAGIGEYRIEKANKNKTAIYAYRAWEIESDGKRRVRTRSLGKVGSPRDLEFRLALKKRDLSVRLEKASMLLSQAIAIADAVEALLPERQNDSVSPHIEEAA